jgi:hypothetical protein
VRLTSWLGPDGGRHLRWWAFYMGMQVFGHVTLSSVGAFFHFLLGHGIGLVEGWLHNSGWELALISKAFALWATHRMLKIRMYRPRTLLEYFHTESRWPAQRAWVVGVFLLLTLLLWGSPALIQQNRSYHWLQGTAFVGMFLWLLGDVVLAGVLQDLFPCERGRPNQVRVAFYWLSFAVIFRLVVPDYFGTAVIMHLHFLSVLFLAGSASRRWSESAVYLLVVAAPSAAFLGLDPLWGTDFSLFQLKHVPAPPFLIAIWMLSWAYYSYRHRWRWTASAH